VCLPNVNSIGGSSRFPLSSHHVSNPFDRCDQTRPVVLVRDGLRAGPRRVGDGFLAAPRPSQ
jgi:hypothetical protein